MLNKKKVITILDKSKDYLSELYFPFDPNNKIKNLVTTVYDKTGKKIRGVKKSEYLDISSSDGFSLYTDNRTLVYKYYPVNSIYYRIRGGNRKFKYIIFKRLCSDNRGIAVEHSAYTISNLSGIELRKKIYPTNLFSIQEEKTETGWIYQVNDIIPIKAEALSPSLSNVVPKISFALSCFSLEGKEGCFSSWNEFGKWMDLNLLQGTQNLSDKAKAEIHTLVKDENRTLPLEILYGYTDSYEFSYIIPQGFITGKLPEDILFTSEFGNYTLFFKEEGNKIIVKRKLVINKGIYSKEKFNDYVKFMNIIYKFDNTKLNLIKKI